MRTPLGWMGIAACAVACGGRDSTAAQALASWAYTEVDGPTDAGTSVLSDQCLAAPLPLDADGEPDCVFLRAAYPHGTASPATLAVCQACNAPGQAPVPASVPLASVSADLAGFDCVCAVAALPASATCPPSGAFTDASPAAWCYAPTLASCESAAGIAYSPAASQGAALYGACFAAGTFPVVETQ